MLSPVKHLTRYLPTSKYHTTIKPEIKEKEKEENTEERYAQEVEEDADDCRVEDTDERCTE